MTTIKKRKKKTMKGNQAEQENLLDYTGKIEI